MPERIHLVLLLNYFIYIIAPKKKDPKKMKKEKELSFSIKTRQKRKHMTSVAGLELFGRLYFHVSL